MDIDDFGRSPKLDRINSSRNQVQCAVVLMNVVHSHVWTQLALFRTQTNSVPSVPPHPFAPPEPPHRSGIEITLVGADACQGTVYFPDFRPRSTAYLPIYTEHPHRTFAVSALSYTLFPHTNCQFLVFWSVETASWRERRLVSGS